VRFFAIEAGGWSPPTAGSRVPAVESGRYRRQCRPSGSVSNYPDFDSSRRHSLRARDCRSTGSSACRDPREVVYPGEYAILEGESRLLDTIERAGGSPRSLPARGTLIRREAIRLEDREYERLKNVPGRHDRDEYEYFKLRSRRNPGRMVVDFHRLIAEAT